MMDGKHDIETCARISEHVYSAVVAALHANGVFLEGCLLKPNMITSGQAAEVQANAHEIASYTIRTLKRTIPAAIPGICVCLIFFCSFFFNFRLLYVSFFFNTVFFLFVLFLFSFAFLPIRLFFFDFLSINLFSSYLEGKLKKKQPLILML